MNTAATPKSVSIIVPTRNEAENIGPLVQRIVTSGVVFSEIVFVDAQSDDGTPDAIRSLAAKYPVHFIVQERNGSGLAAAIMAGAGAATGEVLLVMDADLSHPPERINDLLEPILTGQADLIIGSRYVLGGSTPGWPLWRRIMSRSGAAFAFPLTGVHDSLSGFFAIERQRLLELAPPMVGFKIAFEIILRGRSKLRIREIPIAFCDRERGLSKMSFAVVLRFFLRWVAALLRRAFSESRR